MSPATGNRKRSATSGASAKPRWQRALALTCAVLALGGALHFLFRSQRPAAMPAAHGTLFEAGGKAAGEQIIELLGGRGRVVVLTGNLGTTRSPVQESFLRGFEAAVRGQPAVRLAAVEWIAPNHLGIPAATFFQVLQRHAKADALVSFVGSPVLQEADLSRLATPRPKLIVMGGSQDVTHRLMTKNVVDATLLPRGPSPAGNTAAAAGGPSFNQFFQVLTPATISAAPPERIE